jgi:hypothetical protein
VVKKLFLKNEFETEWNFPRARIPTQLAMPRLNTGAVAGLVALDLFNNTKVNDFSRKIELNCGDSRKQRKVRAALQKEIQHERVEIGKAFLIRHKGPDENIDAMSSVLCALIESHGHCYENIEAKAVLYTGEETARAKEKMAILLAGKKKEASKQRMIIERMMMMDLKDLCVEKLNSNMDEVKAFIASLEVLCSMQTAIERAWVKSIAVVKDKNDKKNEEEITVFRRYYDMDDMTPTPMVRNEETKEINKCIKKITSGESDFETMVSNLADQLREVFSGNYHAKKRAKRNNAAAGDVEDNASSASYDDDDDEDDLDEDDDNEDEDEDED